METHKANEQNPDTELSDARKLFQRYTGRSSDQNTPIGKHSPEYLRREKQKRRLDALKARKNIDTELNDKKTGAPNVG
jgi:hypothetical protein